MQEYASSLDVLSLLLFLFAGMHQVVHAVPDVAMKIDQDVHITGIVQDTNKEPMIGVSVMVKGTTNGTVTDIDGNYSLSVQGSKKCISILICRICNQGSDCWKSENDQCNFG